MRNRLLAGILVAVVALAGWGPARAQDTALNEEQLALLDRVFSAREQLETYTSYVEEASGSDTQLLTIVIGEQAIEFNEATEWQRTQTVINSEDGKNVSAQLRAVVSGEDWPAYTVSAEARYVAGTLYVSAVYVDPGEDLLPPLPEGWLMVEDAKAAGDEYPALGALEIDNVTDNEPSPLLEDRERFREMATDVQLETITLDDGTQADQITVLFGREALQSVISEDGENPFQQMLFDALSDASRAALTVVMDADNQPLSVHTEFFLAVEEFDATTLNPEEFPAGTTLSFSYTGVDDQRYTQIGESFTPVTAPEEIVEASAG